MPEGKVEGGPRFDWSTIKSNAFQKDLTAKNVQSDKGKLSIRQVSTELFIHFNNHQNILFAIYLHHSYLLYNLHFSLSSSLFVNYSSRSYYSECQNETTTF